jgi:hypothetical protein
LKNLQIDDDDLKIRFSYFWEGLKSVDHSMKLHIREQPCQITFPKKSSVTPPIKIAKTTKGEKKRKEGKVVSM